MCIACFHDTALLITPLPLPPHFVRFFPSPPPKPAVRMSDIQKYLLDFDRNKKEAAATAELSATRMYAPSRRGQLGVDVGAKARADGGQDSRMAN